ncbi:MAG: bifunctional ornithine acetyltransferase/N-acetylglutamate synthase [Clostridia bacterium]|nr:bifunctional ornithine acetyltransferase/N-acetylglutamate synthase [Clostridia bacterium]
MRKNGINRELVPILGGVCAPSGFSAGGIRCGFLQNDDSREDLALIVAEKRCSIAGLFATQKTRGAPAIVSEKRLNKGLARAIVVNSGVANLFESGTALAENVCAEVEKYAKIPKEEVLIASTGLVGKSLSLETFSRGIQSLVGKLGSKNEDSLSAARAIMTTDKSVKQLSFAFDLGGYACKIGAICKGGKNVCPNMATTLCFLTTDVNISSPVLQKALSSVARDSLNLLCADGNSSPNDTVFIMANGNAGNYRIDCEDTEYKKFVYILGEVMQRICRALALDGDEERTLWTCRVKGVRSKQTARALCKSLASAEGIKKGFSERKVDVQSVICAVHDTGEAVKMETLSVSIATEKGKLLLFEDGKLMPVSSEVENGILQAKEAELTVAFLDGNFSASAITVV